MAERIYVVKWLEEGDLEAFEETRTFDTIGKAQAEVEHQLRRPSITAVTVLKKFKAEPADE